MGFVLTLFYISLSLLSPQDLAPWIAEYRVELMVVVVALLFSFPGFLDRNFFRIPQNYLLMGLFAAVFLSFAIANHWLGGGFVALQRFVPSAIVFYLVVLNCRSIRRLQIVVWLLAVIAIFYVVQGSKAYYSADTAQMCRDSRVPLTRLSEAQASLPVCSPLVQAIPVSDGSVTFRMQGLGFLRDPNELAQLLVTILPFIWIWWQREQRVSNFFVVLVPTLFFVWGIYLTHSRGAILALVVIIVLAVKDRLSWVSAVVGGIVAFSLMLVLNFSGGREISSKAGSDRLMLWGDGLDLFKESPLFGIGFQGFVHQNSGHTAHNSFVVCLAELGIFGYAFWIGMLAFTLAGLNSLTAWLKSRRADAPLTDGRSAAASDLEDAELYKWARALRISLVGFLATGFFLSRAYSLTLYLILGMAVAIHCLASESEYEEPIVWPSLLRLLAFSAELGVAAIALVYVSLRARAFL
jgi:hypothetical protein